jgi:hypothetical protein
MIIFKNYVEEIKVFRKRCSRYLTYGQFIKNLCCIFIGLVSISDFSNFTYNSRHFGMGHHEEKLYSLECMDYNKTVANRLLNHLLPDFMKV